MIIPYLELPVAMLNGKEEIYVKLKVIPVSIIAYLEQPGDLTNIYLQNGQSFLIALSITDYEATIQAYFTKSAQKQSFKTNLIH
jgi:hypothetical protein